MDDAWASSLRAAHDGLGKPGAWDDLAAAAEQAIAGGARIEHATDLVCAWAAGRGHARAVRAIERRIGDDLRRVIGRIDASRAFVDDILQRVRVRVLVGEGDAPPRIASYRGRGPLAGWLAVIATRLALNARRDRPPDARAATDDALVDVIDREPDPALRHLKDLYRAQLADALRAALGALPARDRALLRLRFVESLELAHIARLYGVHESSASRWIKAALERIADDARQRLIAQLAVSATTADSVARMVASRLDLSIARLLAS